MFSKLKYAVPLALAVGTAGAVDSFDEMAPEDILRALIDETGSPYLGQSPQNLQMMPDNPALWVADDGEALFEEPRGPRNVSLEGCDFGKGPGVLEGAYVELPRYFADTGKVMDLETRLVHCMMTLQGFTRDDTPVKKRHGSGSDMMKLQTYIAKQSNGMKWNPPMDHPLEKAMRDAGEVMFYRRSGHDGLQLSDLPRGDRQAHSRIGAAEHQRTRGVDQGDLLAC